MLLKQNVTGYRQKQKYFALPDQPNDNNNNNNNNNDTNMLKI